MDTGQSCSQGYKTRGQGHKKISEAKDNPFEDRPFLGQGHRRKCSPKKDSNNMIFKNFFLHLKKNRSSKIFSGDLKKQNQKISKKTNSSTKNDLQNFKDSKNTAVLEPRMAIF